MRVNPMILFLAAAVLLLAKSEGGPEQRIEVHSSNSRVEVTACDCDHLQVEDSAHATVRTEEGKTVVTGGQNDGASLQLRVPRNAPLQIATSNGAIRVAGVRGPLLLSTSNGDITVQDTGNSEIHAHTSNGRIEVDLPRGSNANLVARTSNGRIHSDLTVVTDRLEDCCVEGRIGNGGRAIDLKTSNGAIYLKSTGELERVESTFKPAEMK